MRKFVFDLEVMEDIRAKLTSLRCAHGVLISSLGDEIDSRTRAESDTRPGYYDCFDNIHLGLRLMQSVLCELDTRLSEVIDKAFVTATECN